MRAWMLFVREAAPLLIALPGRIPGWSSLRLRSFEKVRPKCTSARVSTVSWNAAKLKKKQLYVNITDEEREIIVWWQERMEMCQKPSTKEMIKRLVSTNLLGLDGSLRNGSLKEGSLNSELLEVKRKFPREVLLCRVGEFYEACGYDACILVEHTGLNPMGGCRGNSIPRAGCPVVNLRQTLDEITKTGLSACIVEEVQAPVQGKQRKGRFIAGHAHPGSPYIYGLAGADTDIDFPEPSPVIGISQSIRGYCFISVLEMMRTYSLEDGLTEEAVVTKLRSTQYQHLFLHRSLRENSAETVRWGCFGEGGLLWGECKGKSVEWYDQDPVSRLIAKVRELYDVDEEEKFREIVRPLSGRPRPVYMSTASQIGILTTPGVPSLLKVVVPADCNGLCVRYLRDLLLNPPPYTVASCIRNALELMASLKCSIPEFVCVRSGKLVKLIGAREVNYIEFSRILVLAEDTLYMHETEELRQIFHLLLEPTGLATGLSIDPDFLVSDCKSLISKISGVLSGVDDPGQDLSRSDHVPNEFFYDMEFGWKGRVQRIHAEQFYKEVDQKAAELIDAIKEDFLPIVMRTKSLVPTSFGSVRAEVCYYREHQAIWFKGKGFKPALSGGDQVGETEIRRLKPAVDPKGKKVGEEWHTTERIELALESYRNAVSKANVAVVQTLKSLSDDLKKQLNSIIFTSVFCVIAKTLFAHVSEGKRRQWALPDLMFQEDSPKHAMRLTDVVPYWLDTTQDLAVPNSIDMNSMYLLTGPNGGGKSSLLRSICAAAVLGLCGLMVPASKAVIPMFDAVMLRIMSQDSPSEGKSLFQMEMSELRSILTEATDKTLVLIDELCKGTEVQKGTCLLASALEKFDRLGCVGLVSTHLHGLLDMELDVKNVKYKAMGTRAVQGELEPTWLLVDGQCRESLAFETAKREGVPDEVLQRAAELYKLWHQNAATALQIPVSNCASPPEPQAEASTPKAPTTETEIITEAKSMEDVEDALMTVCKRTLGQPSPNACGVVGSRQQPPPFTSNHSCVYVLQRPDGNFYVGQTDNLAGRIASHRSSPALKQSPFLYLPVANKSVACQLETALITQLPRMGFNLVNKVDQNHRHFGISPLEPPPF